MMRLSKDEFADLLQKCIHTEYQCTLAGGGGLARSLACKREDIRGQLHSAYNDLADELAASQRREKRLKRQVELMGWLIQSHETDIAELSVDSLIPTPTFDQMGDFTDEGEYTNTDLELICEWCKPAADELLRRQMAADWPTGETMQEIDARENPR